MKLYYRWHIPLGEAGIEFHSIWCPTHTIKFGDFKHLTTCPIYFRINYTIIGQNEFYRCNLDHFSHEKVCISPSGNTMPVALSITWTDKLRHKCPPHSGNPLCPGAPWKKPPSLVSSSHPAWGSATSCLQLPGHLGLGAPASRRGTSQQLSPPLHWNSVWPLPSLFLEP